MHMLAEAHTVCYTWAHVYTALQRHRAVTAETVKLFKIYKVYNA